jgi:spore photoproduct lyase
MQYYLNFSPITVYVDPSPGIKAVRNLARNNPETAIRIGTGEVGDSLLLDSVFKLSQEYIRGLSDLENVFLELKTKTAHVDHLLGIKDKGKAVIAFSLNPERIVQAEEGLAAPLTERLDAAKRVVAAGYRTAFHFDPIIYYPGWKEDYRSIIDSIRSIPDEKVAWISLGTVRYPPGLKEKIGRRRYLLDEFVRSADGKFRYIQKKRIGMYRYMFDIIRRQQQVPVYLCMESRAVWRAVFGNTPGKIPVLRDIFKRVNVEGKTAVSDGSEEIK